MLRRRWLKAAVFLLCLAPTGYLGWRFYKEDLTANPLEYITPVSYTHLTLPTILRV